jgi:hypothetical protein
MMALTITGLPDNRQYFGESAQKRTYTAANAAADYPAGGYVISAANVELTRISDVILEGVNSAGAGFLWQVIIAQTNNPALVGVTSFKLQAWGMGAGAAGTIFQELTANSTAINGTIFTFSVIGY